MEKEPAGQVPEDVEAAGTKDKECVDRILRELEDPRLFVVMHSANCEVCIWVLCVSVWIPLGDFCREHMNVVFIGHVDAGKSTTGGQILLLTVSVRHSSSRTGERPHPLCACLASLRILIMSLAQGNVDERTIQKYERYGISALRNKAPPLKKCLGQRFQQPLDFSGTHTTDCHGISLAAPLCLVELILFATLSDLRSRARR